jgi:uracil-DNA glycosylase
LNPPNRLLRPLDELLVADFGDWQPLLQLWRPSSAGQALVQAVDARIAAGATVYPAEPFRALALTPLAAVKVVILGQDPYHGPGQAEGLAFSVPAGQRPPPSLRNIFKELQRDLGLAPPARPSLLPWAQQGVLLLNTALTVEDGQAASHSKLGWQALTDAIAQALAEDPAPKVFMLWGAHAQALAPRMAGTPHLVLCSNHPSPLSASRPPVPFIGCGHFGEANRFLQAAGRPGISWGLAAAQPVL